MNPENPRIAILGAGGVGGYFGGRWAEDGLEVSLLARGEHLAAIRRDGLVIRSPAGDATVHLDATDDAQRIGPVDLVVVATKTWQLEGVLEHLPPLVGPTTRVVGLQNGVEAAEVIEQAPGSPAPEIACIVTTCTASTPRDAATSSCARASTSTASGRS